MAGEEIEVGGLKVSTRLDLTGMKRDARVELQKTATELGRKAGRTIGDETATEFITGWVRNLRNKRNQAKEELARGLIDRREFQRRGREAGAEFQKALLDEIERRGQAGTLNTRVFDQLADHLEVVDTRSRKSARGVGQLNQSLASAFRQAAHLHPALGQVANVLGSMAIGSVTMAGVFAGATGLALLFRRLTENARKVKEETGEAIERLRTLARIRGLGPAGELPDDVASARNRIEQLERELEFERRRRIQGTAGGPIAANDARVREIEAEIAEMEELIREGSQRIAEAEADVSREARAREAANLAALVAANEATEAETKRAREILEREQARLEQLMRKDTSAEVLQARAETLARINQLQGAFDAQSAPARTEAERRAKEVRDAESELARLEADLQKRLTDLTATATDNLLLQLDRMKSAAMDAAARAGTEVSEEFLAGIEALQADVLATGRAEDYRNQLRRIGPQAEGEEELEVLDQVEAALRAELDAVDDASSAYQRFQQILEQVLKIREATEEASRKAAEKLKDEARKAKEDAEAQRREELRDLRDRARLIDETARSAFQLANAVGAIDDEAMAALSNLSQLGSGLQRLFGGDTTAIPSVLGSAAQLLSGVFSGGDEAKKEEIRAMRALTEALYELRDQVRSDLSANERSQLIRQGESFIRGVQSQDPLDALRGGGFRIGANLIPQARRIEELTGISFLNDDGSVDARALQAAIEALRDLSAGVFGSGLEAQLDALRTKSELLGDSLGTAADQFDAWLDVVGASDGGGAFAEAVRRTLEDEGAAAAEAMIDDLITQFFDPNQRDALLQSDLFAGLTPDEVLRLLTDSAEGIEAMLSSTGSSQSLTRTRTVTEVSFQRGLALDMTRNELLRSLVSRMGTFNPQIPSPSTATVQGFGSTQINLHVGQLIGEVNVSAPGGAVDRDSLTSAASAAARGLVDHIDRELGAKAASYEAAAGR